MNEKEVLERVLPKLYEQMYNADGIEAGVLDPQAAGALIAEKLEEIINELEKVVDDDG